MAKLPNRLVIEITNTDKVDELGNPVIGFESKDYAECIIEELEKMWEKIRALPDINPNYPMDKTIHISRYEVQKIVYERISELKGEQNECF